MVAYNKTKVLKLLTETPGERITVGTHVFNGELRQVVGRNGSNYSWFQEGCSGTPKYSKSTNGITNPLLPDLISL